MFVKKADNEKWNFSLIKFFIIKKTSTNKYSRKRKMKSREINFAGDKYL